MEATCPSSSSSSSSLSSPAQQGQQSQQAMQTTSTPPPQSTKVEELWFDDGGVIIQAGSSLYRVSRGILAARSSVFKHIFQSCVVPRPAVCACSSSSSSDLNVKTEEKEETVTVIEMMDGVPLLKLLDDEKDVTEFLKAVFDSSYFLPYPCSEPSFAAVMGVLRLSHKYDIPYLRRRALNHLNQAYPNTLARWGMHRSGKLAVVYERVHSELLEAYIIIQLALETEADWLIPAAMYKCCTYPIEDLLALESEMAKTGLNGPYFASTTGISATQQWCLTTWPKIRASYHTLYGHLRISTCTDWPNRCQTRLAEKMTAYSQVASICDTNNNPLDSLDSKYWQGFRRDLCKNCSTESAMFYEKWREDLWAELPKLMGLKGWDVLNKMAEE